MITSSEYSVYLHAVAHADVLLRHRSSVTTTVNDDFFQSCTGLSAGTADARLTYAMAAVPNAQQTTRTLIPTLTSAPASRRRKPTSSSPTKKEEFWYCGKCTNGPMTCVNHEACPECGHTRCGPDDGHCTFETV